MVLSPRSRLQVLLVGTAAAMCEIQIQMNVYQCKVLHARISSVGTSVGTSVGHLFTYTLYEQFRLKTEIHPHRNSTFTELNTKNNLEGK